MAVSLKDKTPGLRAEMPCGTAGSHSARDDVMPPDTDNYICFCVLIALCLSPNTPFLCAPGTLSLSAEVIVMTTAASVAKQQRP